jgi:uncharacterized protein YbaP (TraB family)
VLLAALGLLASVAAAREPAPTAVEAPQSPAPTPHPLLWRIEGNPPSWLYGTIHLPDERVLELPPVVRDAIESSDGLFTEIPMDLSTQLRAAASAMLPGLTTLEDELPEELYDRLDSFLESKGFEPLVFKKFKVWAVAMQLELLDHIDRLASGPPLDQFLYDLARSLGKEVGGLETVQEQLDVFETLPPEGQIELLRRTLDRLERYDDEGIDPTERLLEAYLGGDMRRIAALVAEGMEEDEDGLGQEMQERLLTRRNARMADRIAERLRARPGKAYFFAAGAAHFLEDEEGIPSLLRARGFEIRRIAAPADAGSASSPAPARPLKRRAI